MKNLRAIHDYIGKHEPKPLLDVVDGKGNANARIYYCECGSFMYLLSWSSLNIPEHLSTSEGPNVLNAIYDGLPTEYKQTFLDYCKTQCTYHRTTVGTCGWGTKLI